MRRFDPEHPEFRTTEQGDAANARLDALRETFPGHPETPIFHHAYWVVKPTQECVEEYRRRFDRLSPLQQKTFLNPK